jgi:putative ABC transport system permease protein
MNRLKLIIRSLSYYRRVHLWVVLGTMVSTAILVGALVVGDSIRYSLRRIVLDRLGTTHYAISSGDRFFRTRIADDLSGTLRTTVAPLLKTNGIAIAGAGERRINNVQVLGIDSRFGEMWDTGDVGGHLSPDEAIINDQVAARLHLREGDEFLLRIRTLDSIPKDISWAQDSETSVAQRFTIKTVVSAEEFGRFNLRTDQTAPHTVFVSLSYLGDALGVAGSASVMLVRERQPEPLTMSDVDDAVRTWWSLADAGYTATRIPGENAVELTSERIFLDPPVVDAVQSLQENTLNIFSYFVNEIRVGDRTTPYSFVSALSDLDSADDEVLINEWLADDLGAGPGDRITLTYYILGPSRSLVEESSDFRVKSVVPIRGIYADRGLMPDFPGLSDEENCRDWDPGIPIDLDRIRDADEDYWDEYHGTPKVFLPLAAAQRMWHNRFGELTAIRFGDESGDAIMKRLSAAVDPARLGVTVRDVKAEGLLASTQSVDFAQLFLGLSFFIIVAALVLTGLLYVFNGEQRSEEIGLYRALGFTSEWIRRLMVTEALVLVVIGGIIGAVCGILYNQVVLFALKSVWRGAVGTSSIHIHLRPVTILLGFLIGCTVNIVTIRLVAGSLLKHTIADLQKGITRLSTITGRKPTLSAGVAILCLVGVFGILTRLNMGTAHDQFALFFVGGAVLLTGGIALCNLVLVKLAGRVNASRLSLVSIGIRNNVRRRVRSLAVIGLLACGIFIVFTVGANRRDPGADTANRESGTGGFALYGTSVLPVLYDLNSDRGRDFYGLHALDPTSVRFVPFRVRDGDDASCLNLNRVAEPQLIGVDPTELASRDAFSFVSTTDEVDPERPWEALDLNLADGVIPGIADNTVIVWGLGKTVGDTLTYLGERGNTVRIKLIGGLANSVFQGNIIIAEKAFIDNYPSTSGSSLFLVDAPLDGMEETSQVIARALQDQGLDLVAAHEVLARFSQVENTYLSIFLILGTMGLILGCIGIGIVIGRNVAERRGEFALLEAIGFEIKSIQSLILSEHMVLLCTGIVLGTMSALLATLPALLGSGANIPYTTLSILLLAVILNGGFWTFLATHVAIQKNLLPALRNE